MRALLYEKGQSRSFPNTNNEIGPFAFMTAIGMALIRFGIGWLRKAQNRSVTDFIGEEMYV